MRIHTRQRRWDRQVKHRQRKGFGVVQRTIQNGVDNRAGIFDGDTFAGTVPAGVHQVCLRAGCLHAFHQHFSVLRRVQRQEGRAEAGGEGWGWLRHATLGTRQLGGKTGEEVVLRLAGRQARHRRQHAERIRRQENDLRGMTRF